MRASALVWLTLVACSDRGPRPAAGSHAPRDGGTLHLASKDAVVTLDPLYVLEDASLLPVHAMIDTLVGYAPDSTVLVPHLAERWTLSPDGLVYTFALRAASFADGSPIVAADFVATLERARTSKDSPFAGYLAAIATITAPDPRTLVITLAKRDVAFLFALAMPFSGPSATKASGPFELASWDRGRTLVLRRSPHYWDRAHVRIESIELRENIPRDVQFLMFEAGELDAAERLSAADYVWIASRPEWAPYIHRRPMMTAYGSRMNTRVKPFDDRRVRQAMNYAIDKAHVERLLVGTGVAAHGILPPSIIGRDDAIAPYPHDPARAKALLAEAGYPNGFDIDYVVMNDDEAERLAASLQSDLAQVGVRVHISVTAFATYTEILGRADAAPFAKASWIGDFPDPSNFLDVTFHSRGIADASSSNWSFYANPVLDTLLDDAHGELDPAKRAAMYRRAERILYDDAPWIWEYHQQLVEVTQPYVRDYEPHPVWLRDYTHAWLDR